MFFKIFFNKTPEINLNNYKFLVTAFLFLVLIISCLVTYFLFKPKNTVRVQNLEPITDSKPLDLEKPPADLKQLNVLLLGSGGPGHSGGHLTDVIQVAHFDFDPSTGSGTKVALISIPRDLYINNYKINAVYANSPEQAKQLVSQITNLEINYFVNINFVGFKRMIGIVLDGIEVDVSQDFSDDWYPITGEELNPCGYSPEEIAKLTAKLSGFELEKQFDCRYKKLNFKKGVNIMQGEDALAYVRSRHSSSDFDRSRRQREVLIAIKNKILKLNYLDDLPEFFENISQHLQTDIDLEIAKYLLPAIKASNNFKIINITLSTENVLISSKNKAGQFVLIPKNNWQSIQNFIQTQLE